jgi:WD40 repeat protein
VRIFVAIGVAFLLAGAGKASGADNRPVMVLEPGGHYLRVEALTFTPDGNQLVSAGNDWVIRVWDWRTGRTVRTIWGEIGADYGEIFAMALSRDARWLAVGGRLGSSQERGRIRLHDFVTGEIKFVLEGHSDTVNSLAFSPDGKRLVSGSYDKTAILWDVDSGKEVRRMAGHTLSVSACLQPGWEENLHRKPGWNCSRVGRQNWCPDSSTQRRTIAKRRLYGGIARGQNCRWRQG